MLSFTLSFLTGAVTSLIFYKNSYVSHSLSTIFASIGSLLAIIFAADIIAGGSVIGITLPTRLNLLDIGIRIDSFGAIFILIISVVALLASVYGSDYMKSYQKEYNLAFFGFFYNLFILAQILVVSSANAITFLYVWEIMSLASLFLVIFEYKQKSTVQAGIIYFIMTHIGMLFIAGGFLILFNATGSFDFMLISQNYNKIPEASKAISFILFLIGFGTKAGIIPLHIWLPRAHGSAPSQVSALMSGVMIKMGIFMFIKTYFSIMPIPQIWWGPLILVMGGTSSVLGVLYALAEHDIKRLLAYHSIENIGIILMGLGASLIFKQSGNTTLSSIALSAAIFHTINHASFKSLLFLSAGSVISKTHTKNIEKYGELIKKMPYTALFFLIGAIAISGLPPFNGFASEWLTYKSLFAGISNTSIFIKSIFIFAIASLAYTGGLAAACFVKAFGTTFLARPRAKEVENVKESATPMLLSMAVLAMICLVLGLSSQKVFALLMQISNNLVQGMPQNITLEIIYLPNLFQIFLVLIFILLIIYFLVKKFANQQKELTNITWSCGFEYSTPRSEITSTGFSRSLILIFRGIFQPSKQTSVEYIDATPSSRYFTKSKKVMLSTLNLYEKYLYKPMDKVLTIISGKAKLIQTGNINMYLMYILITLFASLIFARYF